MTEARAPWRSEFSFTATVFLLSVFGVAMVYSAGVLEVPSPVTEGVWRRQAIFLVVGIVGLLFLSRIPVRWFEWIATPAYILGLGLLAITLVIGSGPGTAAGVKSFLTLGPIRIQPAEAAKVSTALAMAVLLVRREGRPRYLRDLVAPGALVLPPLAMVLLQPDLGTAMSFVGLFFAAAYWAGTPWPLLVFAASPALGLILAFDVVVWSIYFMLLVAGMYAYRFRLYIVESLGVLLANLAAGAMAQPLWDSLAPYQKNRILVFLDPGLDPQGAGWQLIQSKVAIGSGGFLGKGFTAGTQKRLQFLPEQHTDFIFGVVGEELGFLGTSIVLALFGFLFFRMIRMSEAASNPFAGLFIFGILGVWLTHVCVNVGMTVGLVPITGIPLPFISYGGSFLVMSWVAAAVVIASATDDPQRGSFTARKKKARA